jgi:NAD(P)-dependent dehydrogenase (short-subunit alcohol dehydrogenase family)
MEITHVLAKDLFGNRTVFITGGGSGINLGIARHFAALGANLGICGRTRARLETAAEELRQLGAKVVTAQADVRDMEALSAALERTRDELGRVSCLVCGAAGNFPCPAEELTAGGFKAVVDIDLLGSFNACRAAFPQLRSTHGSIILISAGQGLIPHFAQAHVGAAKAGVDNLMRNLALEWGRYGIRCNSIVPGPIEGTEGMRRLAPGDDALHHELRAAVPLGRFGTVDDIGQAAVFLASPLASYITGATLVVDGGQTLPGSGVFTRLIAEGMEGADEAEREG